MYNKNYDKKLIILKQDTQGYSANKGALTGMVTIEIKNGNGKLSFSTRGLKMLASDKYKAFAVTGGEHGKVAEIGDIRLSKNNESILKIGFNPDNFLGSNASIDDFKVFIVSTEHNKEITPLVGFYNDEKQSFKHILLKSNIIKEQSPPVPKSDNTLVSTKHVAISSPRETERQTESNIGEPCDDEDGIKFYPFFDMVAGNELISQTINFATARDFFSDFPANSKISELDKVESTKVDTNKSGELAKETLFYDMVENSHKKSHDNLTQTPVKDCHKTDELSSFNDILKESNKKFENLLNTPCLTPEEIKKYDIKIEALSAKISGGITEMYKHNPRLNPFPSLKGVEWIRISDAELVFLPIQIFKYMNHPFLATAYEEYKHYALGRCIETGCLYLGIPYLYKTSDKEIADSLKFNRFKCINDKILSEESYGYWIMDIK